VSVIAAGERWKGVTGPLRPALEDLLGAGAILAAIDEDRDRSPEAAVATGAFRTAVAQGLSAVVHAAGSGVEKAAKGQSADVDLAVAHDVSTVVPRLDGVVFIDDGAA
jgi:2-phosphosulfolactate phosphatase